MAGKPKAAVAVDESTSSTEEQAPSVEERQGMRGHEGGNVRPADGRYGLHQPEDESKFVRTDIGSNDG